MRDADMTVDEATKLHLAGWLLLGIGGACFVVGLAHADYSLLWLVAFVVAYLTMIVSGDLIWWTWKMMRT